MFCKKISFCILSFLISTHIYCVTIIYASTLGCASELSIADPTGTTVILDVNLTISPTCPLTLMGNSGDLTFTASGGQQLIIAQSAQWDIASLQKPNTLFFAGNAQLVMQPGAQLLADQSTGINIIFQDDTTWSVAP